MDNQIKEYIESLIPQRSTFFQELEQFAKEHRVPIMEPSGIDVLLQILRIQEPKRILEIGTAIGYSALRMADAIPGSQIITIEMDETRFAQASENISRASCQEQITILKGNALELQDQVQALGPYDAIFIDAAKGQYVNFFELYSGLLTEKGCIYTDNVLFKGLVAGHITDQKRLIGIADKLKKYNEWLMERKDFITTIIPAGDGLAVSRKKQEL